GDLDRLTEFLEVDKEESPVPPIEELRNPDRAAHIDAELIKQIPGARRMAFIRVKDFMHAVTELSRLNVIRRRVTVSEPVVGIQSCVAMVLEEAAMQVVGPSAGNELDLDCALACALSPRRGSGEGACLDRVHIRRN